MGYKYAQRLPFKVRLEEYTPLDKLFHEICNQSEDYAYQKRGRGPTHVDAYREGARKTLELLRSGKFNITITEE